MRQNRKSKRGFTLFELIITISIVMVLLAIGLPGITGWIRRTELSAAEANLSHMVTEAKRSSIQTGIEHELWFDSKRHQLLISPRDPRSKPKDLLNTKPTNQSIEIPSSVRIQFLSESDGTPVQTLKFSPLGIVSSAQVRVQHVAGIEGQWKTNRLTGALVPIPTRSTQ